MKRRVASGLASGLASACLALVVVAVCLRFDDLKLEYRSRYPPNLLAEDLHARGASFPSTKRIGVHGTESSGYGYDLAVEVEDVETIRAFWRSIYTAEPTLRFSFDGVFPVEFCSDDEPDAVLRVSSTSASYVEGPDRVQPDETIGRTVGCFACAGLPEMIDRLLKEEYRRRRFTE